MFSKMSQVYQIVKLLFQKTVFCECLYEFHRVSSNMRLVKVLMAIDDFLEPCVTFENYETFHLSIHFRKKEKEVHGRAARICLAIRVRSRRAVSAHGFQRLRRGFVMQGVQSFLRLLCVDCQSVLLQHLQCAFPEEVMH